MPTGMGGGYKASHDWGAGGLLLDTPTPQEQGCRYIWTGISLCLYLTHPGLTCLHTTMILLPEGLFLPHLTPEEKPHSPGLAMLPLVG